jgi:MerR family transcriptional regulator, copper efflux regulator
MRIGELSTRSGVPARTIRYYEGIGLLPAPSRTAGGYRDYDESAIRRLSFVRAAQSIGLSLGEIREIIGFRDRGESPCAHVAGLIEVHANDLAERIQALEEMRRELIRLATLAPRAASGRQDSAVVCHIIETAGRRSV